MAQQYMLSNMQSLWIRIKTESIEMRFHCDPRITSTFLAKRNKVLFCERYLEKCTKGHDTFSFNVATVHSKGDFHNKEQDNNVYLIVIALESKCISLEFRYCVNVAVQSKKVQSKI